MIVSIGCDHAGFQLKNKVEQYLGTMDCQVINRGTDGPDSVDYPDFAHSVASDVQEGRAHLGIVICGTGNGVAITANKHEGIRCGLCWTPEIAALIRQHNDANMLALPARFIDDEEAISIVGAFLTHEFEGGRHQRRVNKIPFFNGESASC